MQKQEALTLLAKSKADLQQRYGVNRLALFGSTARGAAKQHSDLDILISFDGTVTSSRFFGVQFYLEDLLGCPVDLVTEKSLRKELRPLVEKEAINV